MKTLLNINTNSLSEYSVFAAANDDWNMLSYLNYKYDLNAAVSFSKLFIPDFIESNGCTIISFFYNKIIFNDWYERLQGNISEIKTMCNLYEVQDFFHLNSEGTDGLINDFGNALKVSWELNVRKLFPEKEFEILLFNEHGSTFITMRSITR